MGSNKKINVHDIICFNFLDFYGSWDNIKLLIDKTINQCHYGRYLRHNNDYNDNHYH